MHAHEQGQLYKLNIGFPFIYYQEFFVSGSQVPNFGWNIPGLLYDALLACALSAIIYLCIVRARAIK